MLIWLSTLLSLGITYAISKHYTVGSMCRSSGQSIVMMASSGGNDDGSPSFLDGPRASIRALGDGIQTMCTPK